ncbi:hypothetical protein K435DRAFT_855137 [Dendrothele bispora CBS 962.96]|uniref:DUF6534 domain-containing protein n=1 Tax=Dendrothele bispora (strain CBS 962.96) TaxID=1314807 RepID=A0A4S8MCJ6_DENBC|nr:hypothetical protein K435DRAFT_855137 [Dendrothele bispora CBS 962.96]
MKDLNDVLGSLLIGTWLNAMLYMLEILQVYRYFDNYTTDRLIFKIAVIAVFLLDTLCTIAACASVYLKYSVLHWGDEIYLQQQYWPIPVYLVTTGTCASVVQIFMLSRYWHLTRRKLVTCIIAFMILISLGGSLYSAFIIATFREYSQRSAAVLSATVWFIASAVTDLFIAIALIFRLVSTEVQHKSAKRLCVLSLKTGSLLALSAVVSLIAYVSNTEGNVCLIFGYCLGRIYALTLLYSLNVRMSLQQHETMLDAESIFLTADSARTRTLQPSQSKAIVSNSTYTDPCDSKTMIDSHSSTAK